MPLVIFEGYIVDKKIIDKIKKINLPWYRISSTQTEEDFSTIGFVLSSDNPPKSFYCFKYKYKNKTKLRKFKRIEIGDRKLFDYKILEQESGKIVLKKIYTHEVTYSGVDVELIKKRFINGSKTVH